MGGGGCDQEEVGEKWISLGVHLEGLIEEVPGYEGGERASTWEVVGQGHLRGKRSSVAGEEQLVCESLRLEEGWGVEQLPLLGCLKGRSWRCWPGASSRSGPWSSLARAKWARLPWCTVHLLAQLVGTKLETLCLNGSTDTMELWGGL